MAYPSPGRLRRRCWRLPFQRKGVGCRVQARARGLLEPGADLGGALRVLPVEGATLEDALDGLGHVEPTAAERGVERHDAVPAQPEHHLGALVPGEVVPHQQEAQRRQRLGQGEALRQPLLPDSPRGTRRRRIGRLGSHRQRRHDRRQRLLELAMQDRVGAADDRPEVHPPGRGMEQRQDLARATPDVLVRPRGGVALRPPTAARMRHRLERAGLVCAPDRQAKSGAERVGPLDQPLLAAASGSETVTTPSRLRLRTATPVSHQVRLFCQLKPAACSVRPIV